MKATIFGRTMLPALVCACFSLTAHATAFKCTSPSGQTSYQDTPCQAGAAGKSVDLTDSSSALVTLMADGAMIGMHAWARKQKQLGQLPPQVGACLMSLKGKEFDESAQKALSASMSSGDLQMANSFFASNTGRKVAKILLAQTYQALGETAPDAAPVLNAREAAELQRFTYSSAGQLLIDQRFVANSEVAPAISARAAELKKDCGAHH